MMTRQDCLMYAQGLYHGPGVRVTAEREQANGQRGCKVDVNGVTVAWGANWPACYGELRRACDRRENEHREEVIRRQVVAETMADGATPWTPTFAPMVHEQGLA